MVCESWKATATAYLDGELSDEETRSFGAHVRSCPSCSADVLARLQTKRAIQVAGRRFTPSAASGNCCNRGSHPGPNAVTV